VKRWSIDALGHTWHRHAPDGKWVEWTDVAESQKRLDDRLAAAEAQLAAVREVIADIPESVFLSAKHGCLSAEDAIEAVGDLLIIQTLLTQPTPGARKGEKL
jgi:hypothetical protein